LLAQNQIIEIWIKYKTKRPSLQLDAGPFAADHLDVERLLKEWRWLAVGPMTLVARTVFGDLFLRDESNAVFWLDATAARLSKLTNSDAEFRGLAETAEKREDWFAVSDERGMFDRGLRPTAMQGIGFSIPLVFKESANVSKPYVVDLYELVSFLGDLGQQLTRYPDGSRVHLKLQS